MTIAPLDPNALSPYYDRSVSGPMLAESIHGFWRIFAYPGRPGFPAEVDVTHFRGAPTQLKTMSFSDPFGAKDASISFPQITQFDRRGEGDLWWLTPMVSFQIYYDGPLPPGYPYGTPKIAGGVSTWWEPTVTGYTPGFEWVGRAIGFHYSGDGMDVDLQGGMYQLDDWLAKPEYPTQPLPYEWAIGRQFLFRPALRMRNLVVLWPAWWPTKYIAPAKGTPNYLKPVQVIPGRNWSGLVTRQTGSWDPTLTSYIQSLLTAWYSDRGRWTMDLLCNEVPVLMHRDFKNAADPTVVVIDPSLPDVVISIDEDWSQSCGVVYGQGTSLAGVQYSGMQVSPNGAITRYEPMAALRQVHPEDVRHNPWLEPKRNRREVMLQMQLGLDELGAQGVARSHLQRFAEPGITGTVKVSTAVKVGNVWMPPIFIRAGMSIQLPYVFGRPDGIVAHVTENSVDFTEESNTLTYDTKYRDALTVREVRARGRDSMQIPRVLVVGQYEPPIPDQLIPWDYAAGSGYIPSGPAANALPLFDGMPQDLEFPWESWTRTHPPSNARWRHCYIGIGPASAVADNNWAYSAGPTKGGRYGFYIRAAQSAQIRLLQIAAYDAAGNVMKVPFHVSFYSQSGVQVSSMPKIPAGETYGTFVAPQHYPFGVAAWEKYNADGTQTNPNIPEPTSTVGLIRGYGDHFEKAGYWPGSLGQGNSPTGLHVDEQVWPIGEASNAGPNAFDPYTVKQKSKFAGYIYCMVYCDAQGAQPVYFMGRMFRVEPGANS